MTVNILMETCHEGAAVCAQVGSSKGRPRDFSSMPLAHKLDWVSTRLGLLMCGTVEKWDYLELQASRAYIVSFPKRHKRDRESEFRGSNGIFGITLSLWVCPHVCPHACFLSGSQRTDEFWPSLSTLFEALLVFPRAKRG